jgi:ABC-type transport system involved in cytochrome c biogenesis ATPase subunit
MIFRPMDFLSATLLTALPRLATVKKSLSAVEHNLHFWMSHQNCSAGQRRLPPAAGI